MRRSFLASLALAAVFVAPLSHADEGMWPFNMVPRDRIAKEHGVNVDDAWLDHVRLASVRFNNGGSGSFVSEGGLVLTNHHVAHDCIAKLGSAQHDYVAAGYIAGVDGPEAKCPDLELNQLVAIEDVTDQVKAAKQPSMNDADANRAMKAEMTKLEKACHDKTGLRCDAVTLYSGGKYHLYSYRKFTDVRLVFAPEYDIASFGGDPDNFNYPRFDLDMAVLRVFENGAAHHPKDFLKWNAAGPKEGDVVFTSGSPARTDRAMTVAQLDLQREVLLPHRLDVLKRRHVALTAFGKEGAEAVRETKKYMRRIENSLKALTGMLEGLKGEAVMKKKRAAEGALKKDIAANAELKGTHASVFDDVAAVEKTYRAIFPRYVTLESDATSGDLLDMARDLVRYATEKDVPNESRVREYRETAIESLKLHVLSTAPMYGGVEGTLVRVWLEELVRELGAGDPLVKQVLAGRTPAEAAQAIASGSRLFDLNARKKLWEGGKAAIDASTDPAIVLMRTIDAESRAVRKRYETEIEGPMRRHGQRLAEATFALRGTSVPPDATFTLRLSVGVVKGYKDGKKTIPWATDFNGLYAHATGKDPFKLPQRWLEKKSALKGDVPFNFVSTNDIIGGNSGSPVVNAHGELVGLVFDGNLPSLSWSYLYDDETSRAVHVDTAGMLEALRSVYGATALADELTRK
jgi:hypothetical protein